MEPFTSEWFWRPRAVPQPRLRLFCFPYSGANATVFRSWPAHLSPDVEVLAAQLPGRGPRLRESPISRMGPLVDALGRALRPSPTPFVLFGHSMGGLIAFVLCRWLRARGWPMPAHLIVSGRRAPQFLDTFPPESGLTDEYILSRVRRYGGTPEDILAEPELVELLLPVFRADFSLLSAWRHVPEEPLDVPLTVLGGTMDEDTRPEDLEAWRDQTRSRFLLHSLPGGHFFLHSAESAVLRVVGDVLGEAAPVRSCG